MRGATYGWQFQFSMDEIISIHAPMRGATIEPTELTLKRDRISIHAPMRGATQFYFL